MGRRRRMLVPPALAARSSWSGGCLVEGEVVSTWRAVAAVGFVDDWNVGRNLLLVEQPVMVRCRPVGRSRGRPLRLQAEQEDDGPSPALRTFSDCFGNHQGADRKCLGDSHRSCHEVIGSCLRTHFVAAAQVSKWHEATIAEDLRRWSVASMGRILSRGCPVMGCARPLQRNKPREIGVLTPRRLYDRGKAF